MILQAVGVPVKFNDFLLDEGFGLLHVDFLVNFDVGYRGYRGYSTFLPIWVGIYIIQFVKYIFVTNNSMGLFCNLIDILLSKYIYIR